MVTYATVDEYRTDTGDTQSEEARILAVLEQQSAKLRARVSISEDYELTDDQKALCRLLVTDAARKCLVAPVVEGVENTCGISQTSFTANGFQGSYSFSNPSGSAYWDTDTLKALLRSLRHCQRMGYVWGCGAPCSI